MYYHDITKCDMKNGDGLRVVLWVSGCTHHCYMCQNPQTWDPKSGVYFDEAAEEELFEALAKDYISGITFSGGDPLNYEYDNNNTVTRLIQKVRKNFPDCEKDIWCYTGYTIEHLVRVNKLPDIDVLVDGPYEAKLRDVNCHWRGSWNQRIFKKVDNSTIDGKLTTFNLYDGTKVTKDEKTVVINSKNILWVQVEL